MTDLPTFDTLTFDCYGTLIDWEGGLTSSFVDIFGPQALEKRQALFARYVAMEAELEAGAYQPYRHILHEVTHRIAAEFNWPIAKEKCHRLAQLVPTWTPFPDTGEALVRLKQKYRLGILSNIDRDLFAETSRHFPVAFDFVITAGDVQSYKPAPGHFRALREHADPGSTLHVAQSQFHDGRPARQIGLAFAWINRYNDPADPELKPQWTFPKLSDLARALNA